MGHGVEPGSDVIGFAEGGGWYLEWGSLGVLHVEGGGVRITAAAEAQEVAATVVDVQVVVAQLETQGAVEVDAVEKTAEHTALQIFHKVGVEAAHFETPGSA